MARHLLCGLAVVALRWHRFTKVSSTVCVSGGYVAVSCGVVHVLGTAVLLGCRHGGCIVTDCLCCTSWEEQYVSRLWCLSCVLTVLHLHVLCVLRQSSHLRVSCGVADSLEVGRPGSGTYIHFASPTMPHVDIPFPANIASAPCIHLRPPAIPHYSYRPYSFVLIPTPPSPPPAPLSSITTSPIFSLGSGDSTFTTSRYQEAEPRAFHNLTHSRGVLWYDAAGLRHHSQHEHSDPASAL